MICFLVKSLGEDGYNKNVDEEWDEESDGRLDKEVLVGLFHFLLVSAIDFTRLCKEDTNRLVLHSKPTPEKNIFNWDRDNFLLLYQLRKTHCQPWPVLNANRCCGAWWQHPRSPLPAPAARARSPYSTAGTCPSAAALGLASPPHTESGQRQRQTCNSATNIPTKHLQKRVLPHNQNLSPSRWWESQRMLRVFSSLE